MPQKRRNGAPKGAKSAYGQEPKPQDTLYGRAVPSAIMCVFLVIGIISRSGMQHVHENKHNWRAYMCSLTSDCDYPYTENNAPFLHDWEKECVEEYGSFSPPEKEISGEWKYGRWPGMPRAKHLRSGPISAFTSLSFLVVAFLSIFVRCGWMVMPLGFLAGGSFGYHSTADSAGRIVDHAGCTLVIVSAAAVAAEHMYRILDLQKNGWKAPTVSVLDKSTFALLASVLCIMFAYEPDASKTSEYASYALIGVVAVAAALTRRWVAIANIGIPFLVGALAHTVASPKWCNRASCTNELGADEACDAIHSLWHIAAAVGFREILYFDGNLSGSVATLFFAATFFFSENSNHEVLICCGVFCFMLAVADTFVYYARRNMPDVSIAEQPLSI